MCPNCFVQSVRSSSDGLKGVGNSGYVLVWGEVQKGFLDGFSGSVRNFFGGFREMIPLFPLFWGDLRGFQKINEFPLFSPIPSPIFPLYGLRIRGKLVSYFRGEIGFRIRKEIGFLFSPLPPFPFSQKIGFRGKLFFRGEIGFPIFSDICFLVFFVKSFPFLGLIVFHP